MVEAKERLEALLEVMNQTQGEDSEYSNDIRLALQYIDALETKVKEVRALSDEKCKQYSGRAIMAEAKMKKWRDTNATKREQD